MVDTLGCRPTPGSGDDTIALGPGDDFAYDYLWQADTATNDIAGGRGGDDIRIETTDGAVDGGSGVDVLFFISRSCGVTVDLGSAEMSGCGQQPGTATSFRSVFGSHAADTIYGTSGRDIIRARKGADHVEARAGDDVVRGNLGPDDLNGGPGTDRGSGGHGTDTCVSIESATRCE